MHAPLWIKKQKTGWGGGRKKNKRRILGCRFI